ncbi:ubiquitin carboxyl-terminal hydrolase 12-like isoform X2 [Punica granatum]|uniref:Ubiquitin carboxyl-terminal hydrolase 12-like isoform X2 n=1 Tax=Punica granatum TaxID=22663 RepID=A0A6P8CKW8_PUNGR|nr:ubiquitin carboxyl-terminal hydrolase 12-like isoform X2 [Punica granatum]
MDEPTYKIIRVALDRDLIEQIGRDIYFDVVDHDRVRTFHVQKQTPFKLFKEEIAEVFGIPVQFQRFWKFANRQNHTHRPWKPLTPEEESKPVGKLKQISKKAKELKLFLEVEFGLHRGPVSPPVKSMEDILLFFKLYDPEKGELRYVGRLFVNRYAKPCDILGKVNEMAGFSPDEEVDLYEEIKFEPSVMCELIDRAASFRANQEMDARNRPSERFTWKISNFSKLTSRTYYSEVFTVAGCKWRITIFPKGNNTDFVSIYLDVPDYASLPIGWSRTVDFSLTVVNQNCRDTSIRKETSHKFTWLESDWGFTSFMPLTELHDQTRGYIAQDTVVVEANVIVHKAVIVPPVVAPDTVLPPSAPPLDAYLGREADRFVSYFNGLDEFIGAAETSGSREGPSSGTQTSHMLPRAPSSEEVENAKQSLKECLSDLFKLNMKDRLASALSTLSIAETGLSDEQRSSVLEFRVNFDDFISDYLTFEQDNSEYELQKLQNDLLSSAMKKNRETHLSYKELSEKLAREEEELKKKLEETKSRNAKLISDWEALMAESEETKSKYVSQKPKLAEAEERKRIAEERMSRSTAAWSSLKARFL